MNILHLSAVKSWGGGGNHIENLCYELSISNPEVKNMIVVAKNGRFEERLKKSKFNFSTIPLSFNLDPRAIFKFIRLCKREKIDLVHLHGSTSLTLAVIASRLANLPPFVFSKKTIFPIKNRKQTLYKYNHSQIKKILCVSEAARKVTEPAILDKEKLITIYHGTRIDNKSRETPFLLREKLNIPPANKIVGHIGNHIPAKDLNTWISAIDHLVNKKGKKDIIFIQFGSFSDQTLQLKEKTENLGLGSFVHFMGYMENASNYMSQFDLFSISSKSEGLPQVIYEAAWHKVPVVSTSVGGIPEFIEDEMTGLLSKAQDFRAFAENIEKLLDDPLLGETFASRSQAKLKAPFTADAMARATLQQYREVLNRNI
ncbi:N/A [soil metagenome]